MTLRMPAEWELHEATWLAWPTHDDDFKARPESAESNFVELVRHLVRSEPVYLFVQDAAQLKHATRRLQMVATDLERVKFIEAATNRNWLRDSGAIFVHEPDGTRKAVKFTFNSWGNCFDDFQDDNEIARRMAEFAEAPLITPQPEVVLEGGAIDTDGAGLILATEECLIEGPHPRNSGFAREDYDKVFREYLGAKHTVWVPWGLSDDDTQGHVDNVARFIGPRRVLAPVAGTGSSINGDRLAENMQALQDYEDAEGGLEIIPLPMPDTLYTGDTPQAASYTNFYFTNREILVPTYNDVADQEALRIIQECFPHRPVRGVYSGDILIGGGSIHCLSQQLPARITAPGA